MLVTRERPIWRILGDPGHPGAGAWVIFRKKKNLRGLEGYVLNAL